MAFQVTVAGVEEISKRQYFTKIEIERNIHTHSRAHVTLRWDEHSRYQERATADLAAKLLNCTIDIQWKHPDLSQKVDCFHGYIEDVYGERAAGQSLLVLHCISFSKRTDEVPRYRAFQACKLLDICQQIAKSEPLIKIDKSNDLNIPIDLSLQYGETDFGYLSRMLQAWGIPMATVDRPGEVTLGARGAESSGKFPDAAFGWTEVNFHGRLRYLTKTEGSGSGPTSKARSQVGQYNSQLKTIARDYFPIPDSTFIRDRVSGVDSQVDTSAYFLRLDNSVLPFAPGQVVKFENSDHLIRSVRIVGDLCHTTVTQTFELQQFTLPFQAQRRVPEWPSRNVWAWVVANENDPEQSGRIQVKFDWESLDPSSSSDRAWLHTLTPYGGGKSPADGKAGEYNGFYSLPEVGERVLVEFLGDWDSEAIVMGCVRHVNVSPMFDPKDTKRWRTPSGNEITMTSKGGKEVVRLKCKDKFFLECITSDSKTQVLLTPGESDDDSICFQKGGGPSRLDINCGGQINIKATQKLHLEGQQVQIKASGGNVNIDGAPNVMINCVPLPLIPGPPEKFKEDLLSKSAKTKALPQAVGTAAGGGSDKDKDKKKTWIEIALKDDKGHPVPGERYKIKLPDGSVLEGSLDGDGRARVDGIDPGTAQVSFPDRDANEWKPA